MKIAVLLKQTPDTEAQINIKDNGNEASLDLSSVKYIVNPYDDYATEEALQIKTQSGDADDHEDIL